MDIGIGLPTHLPGTDGATILEWSRRAEARGFASLAVIDRLVYDNYEPLIALTAAAAVTRRPRLLTAILLGPYRLNTALLAKQVASLDALSGGRVVLGLAVGARESDYQAGGANFKTRGRFLDQQIATMRRIWAGEPVAQTGVIGPAPARAGGPPIIIGGHGEAALNRAARLGDGWIMGGGATPEGLAAFAARIAAAWKANGRAGKPQLYAINYFALGDALAQGRKNVMDYYSFAPPLAQQTAAKIIGSADQVRELIAGFQRVGCDEFVFIPAVGDLAQVDLLAEAAGLKG